MSTTQDEAAEANANPSGTLKTSVSIYLPILGAGLLLFEVLRRRFRSAYDSRREECDDFGLPAGRPQRWRGGAAREQDGLFRWIWAGFRVSDDEIMERCGLDTLTFLRFLRLGQKLALLAVGCSVVLFPLYATASTPSSKTADVDPLNRISMSNLPELSDRLWAPTVAALLMAVFTMRLLLQEYKLYVSRRHQILGKMEAQQYSVLVNDLPLHLRTPQTLEAYMATVFPASVRSVYVALECATLESLVAQRDHKRDALEHALAKYELSGKRPKHWEGRSWQGMLFCRPGSRGVEVDAIDHYQEELAMLNEAVAREIQSIEDAQTQLAKQVQQQGEGHSGMGVDGGQDVRSLASPIPWKSYLGQGKLDSKETPLLSRRDSMEEEESRLRSSFGGEEEEQLDEREERRQEREMSQEQREQVRQLRPIRVMRRAAFISFTSLMSAQVAQQALETKSPVRMTVMAAPHVDDIKWDNIGLRYRTRAIGMLISALLSAAIVLFWTIPTAFVASLSTVESLRRALPFLDDAFDKYPLLEDLFKQIAPLALVLLSALAPLVFKFLSAREGHPSNTEVRAALFTKLAFFQLVQVFFVTVIVGTILDSLKEILDQPKKLVEMLGKSMPQQSTFFISYVIVQTGLGLVMELLRVVPVLLSTLWQLLAPKHTRRERNSPWLGLREVSQTEAFDPTNMLADGFLVLLVTLTFAPIAPLVCYFTGFFFVVADVVYRRQVLCVYKPATFSQGAFWPRLYGFCVLALLVAQLTLIGMLSLKKAVASSSVVFALVVVVLLFNYYVMRLYPPVAKFLPLTECVRLDTDRGLHDPTGAQFFFLDNVYRQPAMGQKQPVCADYRLLVDDYSHRTALSSPEMRTSEDQHLFANPA